MNDRTWDLLIIGGGPAGLSTALYLGRARKSVLVLDKGTPRHAVSEGIHNFLTREGLPPAALREIAWEQMKPFSTVAQHTADVLSLTREGSAWIARTAAGEELRGRAALLATGVIDEHPELPGYRERWGHSIHHCPYCHGWELRDRPLALLSHGEHGVLLAQMLRGWSADVMLLTHGRPLDEAHREQLRQAGIPVDETQIAALEGPGRELSHIRLADGRLLERQGLFVHAPQRQVELVRQLGVALDEQGYVSVDPMGRTSLPMLWAAGDLCTRYQQVIEAASQGGRAAGSINMALTLTPS